MDKLELLCHEAEQLPEELLDRLITVARLLKRNPSPGLETALLSESALAKDWLSPEEDEAWQDL
ncbi:MAG: hypothetical protein JSV66_05215 [Trueperaceae bacterium]|nr:MAG: hypothetical protein JSV66_05215 [Trueperaceae bacterium]